MWRGGNSYGTVTALSRSEIAAHLVQVLKFQGEGQLGGALWFLRVLFGVACTWVLVNYLLKTLMRVPDGLRMGANLALGAVFVFLAFSLEQQGIAFLYGQYETVMASYLMYVAGAYLHDATFQADRKGEVAIVVSAFVVLELCNRVCFMLGWNCSVNQMGNPYMFLLTSAIGILCFYFMAHLLGQVDCVRRALSWLGRNSLWILLLQFAAFKLVTLIQCLVYAQPLYRVASFPVFINGGGWWAAYSLAGLVLPAALGTLWSHAKYALHAKLRPPA